MKYYQVKTIIAAMLVLNLACFGFSKNNHAQGSWRLYENKDRSFSFKYPIDTTLLQKPPLEGAYSISALSDWWNSEPPNPQNRRRSRGNSADPLGEAPQGKEVPKERISVKSEKLVTILLPHSERLFERSINIWVSSAPVCRDHAQEAPSYFTRDLQIGNDTFHLYDYANASAGSSHYALGYMGKHGGQCWEIQLFEGVFNSPVDGPPFENQFDATKKTFHRFIQTFKFTNIEKAQQGGPAEAPQAPH